MLKKFSVGATTLFILAAIAGSASPSVPKNSQQPSAQNSQQQYTETDLQLEALADQVETKLVTQTQPVPHASIMQQDATLEIGQAIAVTVGIDGERSIIYEVMYMNGQETSRTEVSNVITKQPVTAVTKIGVKEATGTTVPTDACDPNYTPCIPSVDHDLDCPDIGFIVQVIGGDPHRLDADHDGIACE
jgi:hypothetical protein